MLNRRSMLCGLVAAPAVVAIGSLMPIRGIIMPVRGEMLFQHITCLYNGKALVKRTFAAGPPLYLTATEVSPHYFTNARELTRDEWRTILGIPDTPASYKPYGRTFPALQNERMTKEEFDQGTQVFADYEAREKAARARMDAEKVNHGHTAPAA